MSMEAESVPTEREYAREMDARYRRMLAGAAIERDPLAPEAGEPGAESLRSVREAEETLAAASTGASYSSGRGLLDAARR